MPTQATVEVFVHFFWLIFDINEETALAFLNKERRNRGYWWPFGTSIRAVGPRKTRNTKRRPQARSVDAIYKVEGSRDEGIVGVPGPFADANTSSASSVFNEI